MEYRIQNKAGCVVTTIEKGNQETVEDKVALVHSLNKCDSTCDYWLEVIPEGEDEWLVVEIESPSPQTER